MMIKAYIAFSKILFIAGILLLALSVKNSSAQNKDSIPERYYYFLNSTPFNAEVYYKDSLLGLTPVRFSSHEKLNGKIILKKSGYENAEFDLADYNFETGKEIFLKSLLVQEDNIVQKNKRTTFVKKRNLAGIIATSLLSVTGGALAYNYKEKANDFYSQYVNYGSTSNLDKSKRYDIYYGLSLAVMQVSLAGLIYYLFLE
jgi:hypothetical protein